MPAAYDVSPKRFDDLMREVSPQPRAAIGRRIDELKSRWELEEEQHERREIARAFGKEKQR